MSGNGTGTPTRRRRPWIRLGSRGRLIALLLLAPMVASANGVSPILNFFHKDTWLPASIVTLVIILLESGLLRWHLKGVRFTTTLWRCCILNVASSTTGSVLLLALSRDSFFLWDTMSLVVPLFLITLATEIPLLRVLYRDVPLSWGRAGSVGFGINVASYGAVFVLELGLLFGWLGYAEHLDRKELGEWRNPPLLETASGQIYAIDSTGPGPRLCVCIPPSSKWVSLLDCPSIDPTKWDVEGSTCAFVRPGAGEGRSKDLAVCRLPGFETVLELSSSDFSDAESGSWQGVEDVAVSPDEGKVAIVFRQDSAVAPRNRSSYFHLGGKCRVIVLDVASGQETARASRWASDDGICWLSGSRLLFSSFDDERLYETRADEVRGDTSYGSDYYAKDDRFKRGLYLFDTETGTISRFADGHDPSRAAGTGEILVQDQSGFAVLDPLGKVRGRIDVGRIGFIGGVLSPCGDMVLAEIRRHVPFGHGGRLVLFHRGAPAVRHVVAEYLSYRVDWTVGHTGIAEQLLGNPAQGEDQ